MAGCPQELEEKWSLMAGRFWLLEEREAGRSSMGMGTEGGAPLLSSGRSPLMYVPETPSHLPPVLRRRAV